MAKTPGRLRWRKRERIRFHPQLHELTRGGPALAIVSPLGGRFGEGGRGYFWYGGGMNTSSTPCATLAEAKQQAMEYVRSMDAAATAAPPVGGER